ncbi:MAG: hypothetical protein HZB16_05380 [Armatimonadetes bacterium]|nr:hypothetical protein [Armatimonadota bacterium]
MRLACLLALAMTALWADLADDTVAAAKAKVPTFTPVTLAADGAALTAEQGITAADLAAVDLDPNPPACGRPARPYEANMADGFVNGTAPYVVPGLRPFRLREFTAELSYTGWHNFNLFEYGLTHGFSVLAPYVMKDREHLPAGTTYLKWGDFFDWTKYLADKGIAWGRWDLLAERDVTADLLASGKVWPAEPGSIAMVDLEHGQALSPEQLRTQAWYPTADQAAFEARYYRGYLLTYTAPIEALRRAGWKQVGIYPQPYGSGWYDLLGRYDKKQPTIPDPAAHWPWQTYGKAFCEAQDVLYPDYYVYYWSRQNVAYTLARLDFDRALVSSLAKPKPIRPYFWTLLHGGDAEHRWWSNQPIPTEDARAIFALAFFGGVDGVVLWNWSDVGSHHAPPPLWEKDHGCEAMVGEDFEAGGGRFRRYDLLAVTAYDQDSGQVTFEHIDTAKETGGPLRDARRPRYTASRDAIVPHLRATSDPVQGVVEGLALVRLFEPLLRRGQVKVDVPAAEQFVKTLPIVRRVKLGAVSLLATFDPLAVGGAKGRTITLRDFDGRAGCTLSLPADDQVRLFVVKQ